MEDVAALRRPGAWLWAGAALYACLILAISSIPASAMPDSDAIWDNDKVVHALEYAILGWLCVGAFRTRLGAARAVALAALAAAGFGVVDELYQASIPGRASSMYDAMADGIGAVIGAAVGSFWWEAADRVRE